MVFNSDLLFDIFPNEAGFPMARFSHQIDPVNLSSSSAVTMSLLVVSLINALLVLGADYVLAGLNMGHP